MADSDGAIPYGRITTPASNRITPDHPSTRRREAERTSGNEARPSAKRRLIHQGQIVPVLEEQDEDLASTQPTQPADYTPQYEEEETSLDTFDVCLKCEDGTYHQLLGGTSLIGRSKKCYIQIKETVGAVSRQHAVLNTSTRNNRSIFSLRAIQPLWYLVDNRWTELEVDESIELQHGTRFCVAPPHGIVCPEEAKFIFLENFIPANPNAVGSESFDHQYLRLLDLIEGTGKYQANRKGANWTLGRGFQFDINLRSNIPGEDLVPVTTLRKMYAGRKAIIEALWYIRGDADIKFLQDNHCNFWDAQARDDGFVGLNYGLLTCWPNDDGTRRNQLEDEVIRPLCHGKSSRNMVCSLCKPDEETVQGACTSSVQFGVTGDEELSLTVTQRSSDVILGLPNDVIAWTVVLHLVRREVLRRSQRNLKAGSLHFNISAGGAHVYAVNEDSMNELLQRKPIAGVQPSLSIISEEGLFDLAKNYSAGCEQTRLLIKGYGDKSCFHPALKIFQAT